MAVPELITYVIAFFSLLIASLTDIKTREVRDSLNFGLIAVGIGINLLFSAVYRDLSYIIQSLIGLFLFMAISYGMYYAGQWGGGDSKLLIGLGALFGIDASIGTFMMSFLIILLVLGAVYGIAWSIVLGIKNRKALGLEIKKIRGGKNFAYIWVGAFILIIVSVIAVFLTKDIFFFILPLSVAVTMPLWMLAKAVEECCMKKMVNPEQLTEGDWIAKDVVVNGKLICGPKDLGIKKNQIKALIKLKGRGKVDRILIKEGIPFVPSFLIAFIVALLFKEQILAIVKTFI